MSPGRTAKGAEGERDNRCDPNLVVHSGGQNSRKWAVASTAIDNLDTLSLLCAFVSRLAHQQIGARRGAGPWEVGYRRETVLTGLLVGLTDVSKIGPQSPSRLVVHLDISRLHLHHQSSVSLNSMYNGQPPFRPPFPPTMGSGNGTPPNFPPFPPAGQNGFVRPPFAPNFPPGQQPPAFSPSGYSPGTPLGSASPAGFRPPPGAIPPRPAHPGLGLPPLPAGLPRPPSLGSTGPPPVFKKDVKTTSVFVGSIAPGIADVTLHHLLNACGPLHELKRVEGANGKPQAFGFALFESPEVVMRCIRCLNGVELPDMTPEGRREGKKRALVVKVDEKTRQFLEEFESTVGRSDDEESADASCRKSIAHIVALLTDPNAPPPQDFRPVGGRSPVNVVVPAHLQDLKEGDLPENQRVAVLDQIAVFRENAARREREKQRLDTEKERKKLEEAASNPRGSISNYGYGASRGLEAERQRKDKRGSGKWDSPDVSSPQNRRDSGWDHSTTPIGKANDPQGYDKPVNFVKGQTAEAKGESERTDEEEEELRLQKKARERDHAFRERERRVEDREARRLDNLNREAARRRQDRESEERLRRRQVELFEQWDDDEKADRGERFYVDRAKWRSHRQQARNREYQDDLRDRHREEEEKRKLEAESEEFLKRQMAELAELEQQQRARGLLTEDAAPIKLAIGSVPKPEVKEEKKPSAPPPKVAFDEDEDMDDASNLKKKRTLVKLEDDTPIDRDEMSEVERIARRNAKLLEVKRMVPADRRDLFNTPIEWAALTDEVVRDKIRPLVRDKMKGLLGEVDEDLADFVLEHLKERKGAADLVEGIEPVFAEEAVVFVTSLWRQVVFESAAHRVGTETGNFMV
ncbi:hypothetical protein DB88DRAFT_56444 [Papiliotrema laurentii]|uniref:PWI domain-containing protein n=1 Tax=Papiliotrema laurentii TaxID=5418 RepID=A0AAD9FXC5_PAPLA|nr:hypothetical protein DB88DRAFT_56444 [Papiliotrema laurentii]